MAVTLVAKDSAELGLISGEEVLAAAVLAQVGQTYLLRQILVVLHH
jgi:hypothetical protein